MMMSSALYQTNTRICSVISLKQQSADRHVAPLGHIILIPQHNITDNTMLRKNDKRTNNDLLNIQIKLKIE